MGKGVISFGVFVALAQFGSACILNAGESMYPWLVRVEAINPPKGTIASGWLVTPDRVMTSGSIRKAMDKAVINYNKPLEPNAIALVVFNINENCNLTRFALDIRFHWAYDDPAKYTHHIGEFALFQLYSPFETSGGPTLIQVPDPYEGFAHLIEGIVDDMIRGTVRELTTYIFSDKTSGGAATETKLAFMSWEDCMQKENFKTMKAKLDPMITNYTFFCTDAFPGVKGEDDPEGFGVDMYLGSPVIIKEGTQNNTNGYTPIGHYVYWTGQTGSPFVFAVFTQTMISFMRDIYPPPSTDNDNTTSDTWPTGRPTIITATMSKGTKPTGGPTPFNAATVPNSGYSVIVVLSVASIIFINPFCLHTLE